MNVCVVEDLERLGLAAADLLVDRVRATVPWRRPFRAALGAGAEVLALCRALATGGAPPYREALPWGDVHVCVTEDDRVAPEHPSSVYRALHEALAPLPLPPGCPYRFWTEGQDPAVVASYYGAMLGRLLGTDADGAPLLDLVVLALATDGGPTGVIAQGKALEAAEVAIPVPAADPSSPARYTLTANALRRARTVAILAAGADKAQAFVQATALRAHPLCPTSGDLVWIVDRAAAGYVSSG